MITWTISQLERYTATGFVCTVHWTAAITDGEYSAETTSTVSFTEQPAQEIIPYENLTETQVVEWVTGALGPDHVTAIEGVLAAKIAAQKIPSVTAGLPW